MSSKPEGFGIVYLEAMAAGCVTIGTEGQGIADIIEHGVNGFLVPADDADCIVRVIESCMADPQRAEQIAACGQRLTLSMTWKENAIQNLALFGDLLNG